MRKSHDRRFREAKERVQRERAGLACEIMKTRRIWPVPVGDLLWALRTGDGFDVELEFVIATRDQTYLCPVHLILDYAHWKGWIP